MIKPEAIESKGAKFSNTSFPTSTTDVNILVGKTKFSLYDLKNLEIDDVVVFENSNIEKLTLSIHGEELPVSINPNMDLLIPEANNGGDNMGETQPNIWDSIEVDMSAEFDAVKITLGELKDIEEGLVVDLTSLYDNNVTLKVEGKPIASGSLVIVNDRYGVKINNVIADSGNNSTPQKKSAPAENTENLETENLENNENIEPEENYNNNEEEHSEDEEFDYSDFELEDENI